MEAFFVSIGTIAVAEIGDRTQLLSLVLAARYRRPLPIIAGIVCATLANHTAAGLAGRWFGKLLRPEALMIVVGIGMIGMALWTLKPDRIDEGAVPGSAAGAFVVFKCDAVEFFPWRRSATRRRSPRLASRRRPTPASRRWSPARRSAMLAASAPVVDLGKEFADRLPLKAIHHAAAALFLILGALFLARAVWH